ncbi:MAG: hypothetical protein WCL51_01845 [Bacteroidota bacterium]
MNKKQDAKRKTGRKLLNLRDTNLMQLTPYKGILKDFTDLEVCLDFIDESSPAQNTDNTGIAEDSSSLKLAFVQSIMLNCGPMSSYFFSKNDMTNFRKINYKEYVLKHLKPAELTAAGEIVLKVGTDNLLLLKDYGITIDTLGKITSCNTAYNATSNLPTETKTESGVNTKQINTAFRTLTSIINIRLKNSMLLIKEILPDIYNSFLALSHDIQVGVRSHHDPSIPTGIVHLNVADINTGEGIVGASVKTVGIAEITLTDINGQLELELPLGTHEIKIISFDHKPVQLTVTVTEDEQILDVKLIPNL